MVTTMKTRNARILSIAVSGIFALTALAIFVPSASAQAGVLQISCKKDTNTSGVTVLPETSSFEVQITCDVTGSFGGYCKVPVTVEYTATKPTYATITLNPQSETKSLTDPAPGSTDQKGTFQTKALITFSRQAPAFTDAPFEVKAKATGTPTAGGGCTVTQGTTEPKLSFTLKPGYMPLTQVSPSVLFAKAGQNKKVGFPVEIQNLGNGPTLVTLTVSQPNRNKLDAITAGSEIRLKSVPTDGASAAYKASRTIEALTPHSNGYTNSIYSFVVTFKSEFDGTGENLAVKETAVTFSVQVQGVYVPGFEPATVLVGLGIALAGLAGLRRRE